ncbi:putative O-Antigen ligase [Candidatus Sulfopaludibacter sp. SbA4]|nr:putative O-Antigen ligase [Candidatus Sulfopaludibacter sp. SbA4]
MKYAVLAAALTIAVPGMAIGAMWLPRVRGYLFSLMIALTCLGAHASVNIVSRELYRGPDRGFEVTGADLVCWALMIAITLRFPGKIAWFPRNSWLLLFFFLNACLLALVTLEPLYTAFSLWKCLRIYCLYWTTVNCLHLGIRRRYAWLGFAGAALVIMALALQQKYLMHIYRINGPFDHSNTIPLFANLILPVLLIWALCDKELPLHWAVVSIALCFGLLFAVLETFSRLGMALSGGCVVGALGWANLRSRSARVQTASVLITLLLVAGAIRAAGSIIERIRSAPAASVEARDEFKYAAQLILADHPFGIGLNNFSYVVTNQTQYREHFEAMKNEEQSGVAHHIYWLTAAETGYLGLLLYLLLVVRFAWSALAGSWRHKSTEGTILFGVFLGICALQVSGFFEWAFRVTPVMQMFTITAAMAVAWSEKPREHRVKMATGEFQRVERAGVTV